MMTIKGLRPMGWSTWRPLAVPVAVLLLAALTTFQGYRRQFPLFDMMWDTLNAYALVDHLAIPNHGGVNSLCAFNPPRVAFGMLPGVLLMPGHPELAEKVGSLMLFALTLAGIHLLLIRRFGAAVANIAVLCYGLSGTGLFFAASLWPRAHPCFLVWILYLLTLWAEGRSPHTFSAAALLFAVACYWMPESLPLGLLFVVVFLLYRRRLSVVSLALAAALSVLLGFPYLKFEHERRHVDAKAIIQRKGLLADLGSAFSNSLSDRSLRITGSPQFAWIPNHVDYPPPSIEPLSVTDPPSFRDRSHAWMTRLPEIGHRLTDPPGRVLIPGGRLAIALLFVLALVWPTIFILRKPSCPWSVNRVDELLPNGTSDRRVAVTVILLGFIVPFVAVIVLSGADQWADCERRLLWLVLPKMILVALTVDALVAGFTQRRAVRLSARMALVLLVAGNGTFYWKNWFIIHEGLAGPQSSRNMAIACIAQRVTADGKTEARIGYDIEFPPWMVWWRAVDGVSKVGWEYDLLLEKRFGVTNLTRVAEGISSEDQYRLVEAKSDSPWPKVRIHRPANWRQAASTIRFGDYVIEVIQ